MSMDPRTSSGTASATDRSARYEPPAVTFHGSVGQHTAANHVGPFTDAAFPAHTPVTDLTFS